MNKNSFSLSAAKADKEVVSLCEDAEKLLRKAQEFVLQATNLQDKAKFLESIKTQEIKNRLSGKESLWLVQGRTSKRLSLHTGESCNVLLQVVAATAATALEKAVEGKEFVLIKGKLLSDIQDAKIVLDQSQLKGINWESKVVGG